MAFDPRELLPEQKPGPKPLNMGFDPQELLKPAKEKVSNTVGEVLGNQFDPENFASTRVRLSLSRGDNIEEKNLRIKKFFPDGEVKVLPKSPVLGLKKDVLVFRESPEQAFKMVNPEGFDFTDIAEAIAPSAEALTGEVGMAILTRGATIPGMVARHALGAAGGEVAEQALQTAGGVQAQTMQQQAGEALTEGGLSAAGGFAASPFVAAGNIARGSGALRVGEEGLETIRAARELDPKLADRLTPGLVTDNPALQLQERQSAALLPGLQRRYRELTTTLDNIVKSNIDQGALDTALKRVDNSIKQLNKTFLDQVGNPKSPMSAGGRALQQGIREYDEGARTLINDLYENARQLQEPEFDLTPAARLAQDLRAGSKGTLKPEVEALLKEIEGIQGPIPLSDGGVVSVTDQLRNIRTEAFALKNVPPGGVADQKVGQANDVFKALGDILDNPQNADPRFKRMWSEASKQASERFNTLGKASVISVGKSENPAELVTKFARPGQVDNLATLRVTVSREKWNAFRDSFYADLLSDPSQTGARLKAFDQETLDVLMPRADQAQWKKIGKELERVNSIGVEQLAERQVTNKNFVDSLIQSADPRAAQTLLRSFNNTNDKAARDSIRAAVIDWAWDGIAAKQKTGIKINRKLLKDRTDTLKRNGMWRVLPPEVQSTLGNAEIVARAFEKVMDAGTSIQAAEAAKGIGRLEKGAIRSFVQAGIISHFYLSGAGRRILIGSGLPSSQGQALRLISSAIAQTAPPEDISQLEGRLDPATVQKAGGF